MNTPGIINQAIYEIDHLIKIVNSNRSTQVRNRDEQELIKANVFSWFNEHRPHLQPLISSGILDLIDEKFRQILEFSDKQTSRSRYRSTLKLVKRGLIELRSESIRFIHSTNTNSNVSTSTPNFSKLIADDEMIKILVRRWKETITCIDHEAPLSAMVMMGALLEALLLARINKLSDKKVLFALKCTPRDRNKKALELKDWGLKDFIEVAFEMKWIRKSVKDISVVIRDYRNFIHPVKELSSGFQIENDDAKMFWPIFVQISEQIIKS